MRMSLLSRKWSVLSYLAICLICVVFSEASHAMRFFGYKGSYSVGQKERGKQDSNPLAPANEEYDGENIPSSRELVPLEIEVPDSGLPANLDTRRGSFVKDEQLLLAMSQLDAESKGIVDTILAHPEPAHALSILYELTTDDFTRALAVLGNVPGEYKQAEIYDKNKNRVPVEYRIISAKDLDSLPDQEGLLGALHKFINKRNPHFLVHIIANGVIYLAITTAIITSNIFLPELVYGGTTATIQETSIADACELHLEHKISTLTGPVTALHLPPAALAGQILLGTSIAYFPSILLPRLVPLLVQGYRFVARKALRYREKSQQAKYSAQLFHHLAQAKKKGVNIQNIIHLFSNEKVKSNLAKMSQSPRESLEFAAIYQSISPDARSKVLGFLQGVSDLKGGQQESDETKLQWLTNVFGIDRAKGDRPWATPLPNAVYQVFWNKDPWYIRHIVSGLVTNAIILGGLVAAGAVGHQVAIAGPSTASITIGENFTESCLSYNQTGYPASVAVTGPVIGVNSSAIAGFGLTLMNLTTGVLLPAAADAIKVTAVATANAVRHVALICWSCFRPNRYAVRRAALTTGIAALAPVIGMAGVSSALYDAGKAMEEQGEDLSHQATLQEVQESLETEL